MTARTHDLLAFAFLATAAVYVPPVALTVPTLFTSIVGNVVGSLIPDLDQASNRLWDLLPGGNFVGRVFRHAFLGHRTISHSLLGGYILYKFLEFALPRVFNGNYVDAHVVLVSIMLGFVSHLVGDAITKEGIPLFFPFKIKFAFPPLRLLRVTTDSWVEHLVILPLILLYLGYFFVDHQGAFISLLGTLRH